MFLLNLAIVAGVIYLLRRPEPHELTVTQPATRAPSVAATKTMPTITVHLGGAIVHEGDLHLPGGARLADALDMAGLTTDADVSKLQLGRGLRDGESIIVPGRVPASDAALASPATPPATKLTDSGNDTRVNLNAATLDELVALPGIGPALAQRILDYRAQHGAFKSIEELKNVKGIGDAIFDELKERITVQ